MRANKYVNNLALTECSIPLQFDSTNMLMYDQNEQPSIFTTPDKYNIMNPNFGLYYAPFRKMDCPKAPQYTVMNREYDPRLYDPIRNINMFLDRPPFQGDLTDNRGYQMLENVYNPQYIREGYGRGYSTYADIDAGQNMYYLSEGSVNDAYFDPVFIIRNKTDKVLYRDPMSAIKPQFFRTPFTETLKYISNDQQTRDTLSFREDIMSHQMSKMNSQSYQKTN